MQYHDWTESDIALLGKQSDGKVAKILGITNTPVRRKRMKLGIPIYEKLRKWTEEETLLLGTMSDNKLAIQLERTSSSVRRKRQSIGIPGHGLKGLKAVWTPDNLALLGTMSDAKLAKKLGISPNGVANKRQERNILPFNYSVSRGDSTITPLDEKYYILNLLKSNGLTPLINLKSQVFFDPDTLLSHVNDLIKTDYLLALDRVPIELLLKKPVELFFMKNPYYIPSTQLPKII